MSLEPLCAAILVVLSLCGPGNVPNQSGAAPRMQVVRVSQSNDLLGRQMAVAPFPAADSGPRRPDSTTSPWGDPRRMAFCGPDGIQRTLDGGQSWSRVPTNGVAMLAAGTEMPLAPRLGQSPSCQSVTLHPKESDTFYAVFQTVTSPQDAPPPWFAAGYVTRDAGQTWQPGPPTLDVKNPRFGGFVAYEIGVQALSRGEDPAPTVQWPTDDPATWDYVPFGCPASGACIRWGAPPTGIGSCNMHGYGQPLVVSVDGGRSWTSPEGAKAANACRSNELVVVSHRDVLLLTSGAGELEPDAAPVRVSHDGGRTFEPLALPEGPAASELFELHLLPDERLLARVSSQQPGGGWSWQILWHDSAPPAQDRWCRAAEAPLPSSGAPLRVAGDRLWWVSPDGQPASLALADLHCAE